MIPVPASHRVYLSTGVTDMRPGMPGPSLQIERLRRDLYGRRSERTARLLDRMALELAASATEDGLKAEMAAEDASSEVKARSRKRPSRTPFPAQRSLVCTLRCRADGW